MGFCKNCRKAILSRKILKNFVQCNHRLTLIDCNIWPKFTTLHLTTYTPIHSQSLIYFWLFRFRFAIAALGNFVIFGQSNWIDQLKQVKVAECKQNVISISSSTKFGNQVWPYLAKFQHFGNILKRLAIFDGTLSICNSFNFCTLAKINTKYLATFSFLRMTFFKKLVTPFSSVPSSKTSSRNQEGKFEHGTL